MTIEKSKISHDKLFFLTIILFVVVFIATMAWLYQRDSDQTGDWFIIDQSDAMTDDLTATAMIKSQDGMGAITLMCTTGKPIRALVYVDDFEYMFPSDSATERFRYRMDDGPIIWENVASHESTIIVPGEQFSNRLAGAEKIAFEMRDVVAVMNISGADVVVQKLQDACLKGKRV